MKEKSPILEKISPSFGTSITIRQYSGAYRNKLPYWHVHPEMELVYVNGGSGKRQIGNQLSHYDDGDLIFLGANIPHFGFTDGLTANKSETIVQVREDFLGEQFFEIPEMASVKKLIQRAKRGLVYYGATKEKVGAEIEGLVHQDSFERVLSFLSILKQLASSQEYTILNVEGFALEAAPQHNDRLNIIYKYVGENFRRPISLHEIADQVSLTEPAFCRYFRKITGKTFIKFVNEYRLLHGAKLLAESTMSITDVCYECGFNNFSHFNKQFKALTGKSPSVYRSEFKHVVKG